LAFWLNAINAGKDFPVTEDQLCPDKKTMFGLPQLRRYTLALVVCWLIVVALSLVGNLINHKGELCELVTHIARINYQKDILYRRWNAEHGGVYARIDDKTPPNPYLEQLGIPDQNIATPAGVMLTLINPSYMTRQVYELVSQEYAIIGHMASLKPIRPGNLADEWETRALRLLSTGQKEVSEFVEADGKRVFRFMRPFYTEESCLRCHIQQGYQVGDVQGGLGITVATEPFQALINDHILKIWLVHLVLGALGLVGVWVGFSGLKKRIIERDQAEDGLRNAYDEIEKRVAERTHELGEANLLLKEEISNRQQITEEKERLEGQLRQVHKMEAIGTLAGGIAHDFNNMLTPIIGYGQMLADNLPVGGLDAENAAQIVKAGNRAKDLVRQILTFSRDSSNKLFPFEIHLEIKEALKFIRASLPASIEIKQNIDTQCGSVLADPTQIHQIVMNLCTNGYHAMRDDGGGVLEVSLSKVDLGYDDFWMKLRLAPGSYLKLEVSDTGHGMEQWVMDKIFDPYFTTKGQGDGTGLGLSVVHGIVKSLGGHIMVNSEKGKGATFKVYLPCYVAGAVKDGDEVADGAENSDLPRGHETIMVVDDQQVVGEMVQLMLELLGYTVETYTDGRRALADFRDDPDRFQLVITDMAMPNMQGDELARKLLEISPRLPVILCTGFSEAINDEKAKLMGIREYIMKPILKDELGRVVGRVLHHNSK